MKLCRPLPSIMKKNQALDPSRRTCHDTVRNIISPKQNISYLIKNTLIVKYLHTYQINIILLSIWIDIEVYTVKYFHALYYCHIYLPIYYTIV